MTPIEARQLGEALIHGADLARQPATVLPFSRPKDLRELTSGPGR